MTPEQFRASREVIGLSQIELAEKLQVSRCSIMRWENSQVAIPGPAQVAMLFMLRDAGIVLDFNKGE